MAERDCRLALERIALGESGGLEHARSCSCCGEEALRLRGIVGFLGEEPVADVPAHLEARLRAAMRAEAGPDPAAAPPLRPSAALALSSAALASLVAGASILLAATPLGGAAPAAAGLLAVAYLLLAGVSMLPILVGFGAATGVIEGDSGR